MGMRNFKAERGFFRVALSAVVTALLFCACGTAGDARSSTAESGLAAKEKNAAGLQNPAVTEKEKTKAQSVSETVEEITELRVFAAASMTETMDQLIQVYEAAHPEIRLTATYDSSGTLLKQIQEGAECDLFISAAEKQMDTLETEGALLENSRTALLENRVTLAVPEGNPKQVKSFGQLAEMLQAGGLLLAVGNSDVPVGQYSQKIFAYYGLEEEALAGAGVLTYGSNVKEVTTQISEGSVDCGIIYATDAFSAGLTTVDSATKEMCGQVIYPAAVLRESPQEEAAQEFLRYLQTDDAARIFESVGFTAL